jgi:type 1 fimbria pilin
MTSVFSKLAAGLVMCSISLSSTVSAEESKIVFSGSIVAPTCPVALTETTASAASASTSLGQRFDCDAGSAHASAASRFYASTTVQISGSQADRVLRYFDEYVKSGSPNAKDPVVVTQTYE